MDKGTGGRLKKMAAFARYIDEVFSELERALSSVDALMPDEAHHEQARCIMETLLEEITEMDKHTHVIKAQAEAMLDKKTTELNDIRQRNATMQETLSVIEDTLKNYGYDSSQMPDFTHEVQNEQSSSSSSESESSLEEEETKNQPQLLSPPSLNMSALSESDITPIFRSSNSQSRSHLSVLSTPGVNTTPQSIRIRTPLQVKSAPQASQTSVDEKVNESTAKTPKMLVMPKRPILSEFTYQLLGEQPPPEFYEKQNGSK